MIALTDDHQLVEIVGTPELAEGDVVRVHDYRLRLTARAVFPMPVHVQTHRGGKVVFHFRGEPLDCPPDPIPFVEEVIERAGYWAVMGNALARWVREIPGT